jgi:hypothetical protein
MLLVLPVQVNGLLRGGEILDGQDHGVLGGVGAEVARRPAAGPGREAVSLRVHTRIPGRWPGWLQPPALRLQRTSPTGPARRKTKPRGTDEHTTEDLFNRNNRM